MREKKEILTGKPECLQIANFDTEFECLFFYQNQRFACMCACVLSCFSSVELFETLQTIVHQGPLSMGLSRQEYWRGLPNPPPGDLYYSYVLLK